MSMKQEFTAHDMATAAADGFRDGQRAALDHSAQSLGMVGALVTALDGLLSITQDSTGVAGYHLNGNVAEWDEFPEVDTARDVISAYRATDKESLTAADSQASADDSRKLSDLGNELHNLSCHVVHVNEGWAEQIGKIACELWKWPQASASQSAPAGEREAFKQALHSQTAFKLTADRIEAAEWGAAWQRTQSAGVPEGWKLVPVEPTEEMWSGLARHLMMWLGFGNPTVEALRKHLDMLNIEWPAWMDAESELRGSGVPSKGTRATLIYKAMLAAAPAQPAAQESASLDKRMRAAGMMTVADLLAGAPLDAFIKHAGVNDLASLLQWAEMRRAECLEMQARYDLGERDKGDDLYEWTIAHCAVFTELHVNIRAALAGQAAQDQGEVQRLREALTWLRGAINCTAENDTGRHGVWFSTKHPMIQRIDELLAARTGHGQGEVHIRERWTVMCGHWQDTTLAIHGERTGHIASGIDEDAAHAIVNAHNQGLPPIAAASTGQEVEK